MSLSEINPRGSWERPNINVPLPEEPDDEWCGMFTEAYGNKGIRTTMVTWGYMREQRRFGCSPQSTTRPRVWNDVPSMFSDDGAIFEGEVVAARMVPEWSEPEEDFRYATYVVLRNVIETTTDKRPTLPEEELWIPLYPTDEELVLF